MSKGAFFKKIHIREKYFEGLWIGYYIVNDEIEYYFELVEQDLENLSIKGKSFNKEHKYIGAWTIVNPNINIEDSKLTYYYEMDVAPSGDISLGFARSTIYWDRHNYAYKETGFAIDNFSPHKQHYVSQKIGNFKRPNDWIAQNFWAEVEQLYENEV